MKKKKKIFQFYYIEELEKQNHIERNQEELKEEYEGKFSEEKEKDLSILLYRKT